MISIVFDFFLYLLQKRNGHHYNFKQKDGVGGIVSSNNVISTPQTDESQVVTPSLKYMYYEPQPN